MTFITRVGVLLQNVVYDHKKCKTKQLNEVIHTVVRYRLVFMTAAETLVVMLYIHLLAVFSLNSKFNGGYAGRPTNLLTYGHCAFSVHDQGLL